MSTVLRDPTDSMATPEAVRTRAHLRAVLRNGVALLGAYVLPRLLTFGAVVIAARMLGAEQFGSYGTAANFAVILSVFATLGMTPLLTRDIAREPDHAAELLRAAHAIKTGSNLFMLFLLYAVAWWIMDYPPAVRTAALLLGIGYAIGAYTENYAAYYQGVERMHVCTQASSAFGLVAGTLGALLAVQTRSVVWFALAPMAGHLAALMHYRSRLPREARQHHNGTGRAARALVGELAPFIAGFTALTIYCKVDVLLLNEWSTITQVGYFAAAYKFIDIMQALTIVAAAAAFPRLARRSLEEIDGPWAGTRLVELVVLGVLPVAGVLWLARTPITLLLFGAEFAPAAGAVAALAPVLPALAINIVAGYVLGARGRMFYIAAAYGAAIVLNVALNRWLVPLYGANGAAFAKLLSEWVLAGVLLTTLHHLAEAAPGARTALAAAALAAVCGVLVFLPDATHGWLRALVFAAATVVVYAKAGVLAPHELSALRSLLPARMRLAGARES
jgi:O-antigen/teichoic acid export membrane protein